MFKNDKEGYMMALKYLDTIGELERFLDNGWSTDGYSLVNWANAEYKDRLKEHNANI